MPMRVALMRVNRTQYTFDEGEAEILSLVTEFARLPKCTSPSGWGIFDCVNQQRRLQFSRRFGERPQLQEKHSRVQRNKCFFNGPAVQGNANPNV